MLGITAPHFLMAVVRIALADDQALVREGLKLVLRSLDIEIAVEAADGRELIDKLATATVDVIVSDVRMPALSGIEALRALRARGDRTPDDPAHDLRRQRGVARSG